MTEDVTAQLVELADAARDMLSPSDWARLRDVADRVAAHDGSFAKWVTPDREPNGVVQLSYSAWGPLLEEAVQAAYDLGLVVPFAWPEWEEGRRLVAAGTFDPATLTWAQTVGLLTALIRQDRFSEGALAEAFDAGTVPGLLVRLLDFAPTGSGVLAGE